MITFFKNLLTRKAQDRKILLNTLEGLYRAVNELSGYLKEKDEDENSILVCLSTQGEALLAVLDEIRLFTNGQKGMVDNMSKYMKIEVNRAEVEMEAPEPLKPTEWDSKF